MQNLCNVYKLIAIVLPSEKLGARSESPGELTLLLFPIICPGTDLARRQPPTIQQGYSFELGRTWLSVK
jgi:hypothetical protein